MECLLGLNHLICYLNFFILQNDGNEAIKWFKINGMQANPTKFQGMILSPHEPKSCTITLADNTEIKSENTVNLLGVLIDDKLNFTQHMSAML